MVNTLHTPLYAHPRCLPRTFPTTTYLPLPTATTIPPISNNPLPTVHIHTYTYPLYIPYIPYIPPLDLGVVHLALQPLGLGDLAGSLGGYIYIYGYMDIGIYGYRVRVRRLGLRVRIGY